MSTCPDCGAAISAELKFCLECGSALEGRCPACGTARVPGAKFCGECGVRLDDPAAAGAVRARPLAGSPVAAIPVGAAVATLGSARADGLERRLVSVLFADLVGFTARSESRDPEAVREFLTRYFDTAAEVIGRYGGSVEKFIGDAVMAVWGTPTAHEDDAERAVRAALDLVDAVRTLGRSAGPDAATDDGVELRAAVMTGDVAVTVGATGQGMVAGDLVNSASRLQAAATPGTVLVDETTQRAAARAIAFEPAGEHVLRGKTTPLATWRALRVVAERGGLGRAEGIEPPFIGREEELRLLKEQLHATGREGRARLVTILGEAGMGKSRLVWEFLKYVDGVTEDIFWHQGRSPAYGEGIAYWALGEMVRRRAGIAESGEEGAARARLAETVARFVPDATERRWIEPSLAALLGLADAPAGEREELFAAWRTFFERISIQGTTVLVFEDLHWADQGLLDFIESVLEWSRGKPILVVGLARPELLERRPGWGRSGRASVTLNLEPVPSQAMAELLRGTAPGLPPDAVDQIVARSEGVPLYAVETVRMLLDEGRLVRDGERFRLADVAAPFAVPASLHALIAARLDALGSDDRSLLQDAAVLGRTFSIVALAAVSSLPASHVEERLRALQRKELVALDTDPRSPEQGQYGFVHGLFREIAYATLSKRDRRTRHLAAARYFEALGDEELSGVLASHYLDAWRAAPEGAEGAAVAAQARVALRAAAERAVGLHANVAAVGYFEQALTVTDDPAERAAIHLRMADPAEAALGVGAAQRYLRDAIEWYEAEGDMAAVDGAVARLARSLIAASRTDEAQALLAPVVARRRVGHEDAITARVYNEYARTFLFSGESRQALDAIEQGLAIAERRGLEAEVAELLISKAWAMNGFSRPREAAILAAGAVEFADRGAPFETRIRGRMNLSNWYLEDDPGRAQEVADAGVELARRVGNGDWAAALAGNAAGAAIETGDWDAVIGYLDELDRAHLTTFSRFAIHGPSQVVRAYRGQRDPPLLETPLGATMLASAAPQDRSSVLAMAALQAFAAGDFEGVSELSFRSLTELPDGTEARLSGGYAGHAAVLRRDAAGLDTVIERIEGGHVASGALFDTSTALLKAAADWLHGRSVEAERAYRATIEVWRRLKLPPEIALAELEMLILGGSGLDDREALADEAQAIYQRLGARHWAERVEAALLAARSTLRVPARTRQTSIVAPSERPAGTG